ncbi:MAG: hypothetical protein A2848_03385 [Candidatus Magasanikbacteria bacterium RIFCSPHIGHO2_01_FULL_50_8]|uniref:Uncharacterized protein n=2 Tax=Candidatus Magasanikiibacteriota TaxID=1752731 RepID=A0A1F6LN17_9BACT|nr:MAG: hypothetical protein A2848_03385 [Candidatus Magasanikbacteria bacterium RIFCSPHIGHO2_01_FULL_50_8]OGH67657.1 MAG: hypothetical protein A3C15_02490 [Candidatus Magasanikbacteria bacterium RIFCSPHIGHO2_02_FULL_50_9b]
MWTLLILKLLASIFLMFASTMIIDWIFSGSAWARKYYAHAPNIWRPLESGDPSATERRIIRTSLLVTLGFCIAFALYYFVMRPGLMFAHPLSRGLATAISLWLIVPLPLIITQHLYVKYHRATTLLQLTSWLAKLTGASLIMTHLF